jgi:hypothetical protein
MRLVTQLQSFYQPGELRLLYEGFDPLAIKLKKVPLSSLFKDEMEIDQVEI